MRGLRLIRPSEAWVDGPIYGVLSPVGSGTLDAEIDRLAADHLRSGVALSGAVGLRHLEELGARLAVAEARLGLPDGTTRVLALLDSARAVLGARDFSSDERPGRLGGLGFDPGRLAVALGCAPSSGAIAAARAEAILCAAAADVPALLLVARLEDAEAEWDVALRDGFAGLLVPA